MRGSWAALVVSGAALAQDLPRASSAGDQATAAIQRGDYMAARRVLEQDIAAAPDAPDDYTLQMWRQITPMLTGELSPEQPARGRSSTPPGCVGRSHDPPSPRSFVARG